MGISNTRIAVGIGISSGGSWVAPTGNTMMLIYGNSFTVGANATNWQTEGFPQVLKDLLESDFGDGGSYMAYCLIAGNERNEEFGLLLEDGTGRLDCGSWTGGLFNGMGGYFDNTTTLNLTVNGSSMDLIYGENIVAITEINIVIDGGTPIKVGRNLANDVSRISWKKVNISLGTESDHTVVITGGDYWQLAGVIGKNANGISLFRSGLSGARAANFANPEVDLNTLKLIKPRIVIAELGINDFLNQVSLVDYETYIERIIVAAQESSDCVILVTQPEFPSDDPVSSMNQQAGSFPYHAALTACKPNLGEIRTLGYQPYGYQYG